VGAVSLQLLAIQPLRAFPPDQLAERLAAAFSEKDPIKRVARVTSLLGQQPARALPVTVVNRVRVAFDRAPLPDGEIEFASFGAWLSQAEPESTYRWLRESRQGRSLRVFVAVFEEWGERDPIGAARAANRDAFEKRRESALRAAVRGATRSGPLASEVLISMLEEIPNRGQRRAAVKSLVEARLARDGIDGLLKWIGSLPTQSGAVADDLAYVSAVAISSIDPVRATGSLHAITDVAGSLPPDVAQEIASIWDDLDPLATLVWLSTLDPASDYARIVHLTFHAWMRQDRFAALSWADQRAEDPAPWLLPIRALYGFVVGHEDSEEGLRLLFQLPINSQREQFVRHLVSEWKESDPEAAAAWLEAADLPADRKERLRKFTLPHKHKLFPDQASVGPRVAPAADRWALSGFA
jgi:hypothetical protein